MERCHLGNGVRIAAVAVIFTAGFVCGSVTQRNADAQMGEVGGELLKKAAGSGGVIGTAAQLGTAINDMQQQVNGLQKNLEILKKIRGSLGGHK